MHRLILLGALVVAVSQSVAAQDSSRSEPPSIVTSGHAVLRRAPDVAFVVVAVESRSKNPKDAQQQNAATMTAVQQRLTQAGIAKDAVRTQAYDVQPEFDFVDGRRVPRGYLVRNAIEVRVDPVDRTGDVIDTAVQAGATSIGSVRFDLKDRAGAEREALRLAVVDARGRADAVAAGAGRAVDRVLRIEDSRTGPPDLPRPIAMPMARAGDAQIATPLEAGTLEVRAQVTMTVAIR
jgi:uncharacterized protein YggE